MQIAFSPQRRDDALTLSRAGDVLTVNGVALDFSAIGEGDTLPRDAVGNAWVVSDVTRTAGVLSLSVILPLAADAVEAARFPDPVTLVGDGAVTLPGAG
jgi:hypothetical protein